MEKNTNNNRKGLLNFSSKSYEDYITYEKVHRHLRDINDVISEEDIRSVRTDMFSFDKNPAGKEEQVLITRETKDGTATENMDDVFDEGKKITSSWNILSE